MTHLISVIIPVYNVALYLSRCLESVIHQTYRNIEVLLIDDGSTDGSAEICDEYASRYSFISVHHKQNGGVSSARNLGIYYAKGDYITFIDSDDTVETCMIASMYSNAIQHNVLLSCCLMDVVEVDGSVRKLDEGVSGLYTQQELLQGYFNKQFVKDQMYGPVNKLYHKSLLANTVFKPYSMGEDILFVFEILLKCPVVYISNLKGYHYLHREGSAMTSSFSMKRLDYIYAAEEMLGICKTRYPFVENELTIWLFSHILVTLRQIEMTHKKSECCDFYEKKRKWVISNRKCLSQLPFKRKLDYIGILYFPLYFTIIKCIK